jgi:mono/diheme cytochrome c family protein
MTIVKRFAVVLGLVVAPVLAAVHVSQADAASQAAQQQTSFSGRALFSTYCATCHGASGKGDGPFAAALKKRPPDLTQLAKLNEGTFPEERVTKTVDGREAEAKHGADMPVWGDAFSKTRDDNDPESVRLKIRALVKYVETLQERPISH